MPKRVLDVGNCSLDHGHITGMLSRNFSANVVQAHGLEDTLDLLRRGQFDLVLVNRKLDQDYSDGLDIIKAIKADAELANVPCMLVTNYPEYQQQALAAGALLGFGKKELADPDVLARLKPLLT